MNEMHAAPVRGARRPARGTEGGGARGAQCRSGMQRRVYCFRSSWLFPTFADSGSYPLDESFPIGSGSALRLNTPIAENQNHQKLGRAHLVTQRESRHRIPPPSVFRSLMAAPRHRCRDTMCCPSPGDDVGNPYKCAQHDRAGPTR